MIPNGNHHRRHTHRTLNRNHSGSISLQWISDKFSESLSTQSTAVILETHK